MQAIVQFSKIMAKPIKLTDTQKRKIKDSFAKINPKTLSGERLRYYNLIKAGKQRNKNSIRLKGKYLSGEIVDIVKKVAKKKRITLKEYIKQNEASILSLIDEGYTHVSKDYDKVIDIINNLRRRTVEVDTGNGIVKMKKHEAIEKITVFQQHVKSTTNIVAIGTEVRTYKTGKIRITIPEDYEDYPGNELTEFLDEFDTIFYIESDSKAE